MKKPEIIEKLKALKAEFDPSTHHSTLGALLKKLTGGEKKETPEKTEEAVTVIKVKNVMRKRNAYVSPTYRLERDEYELAKITSRRDLKGKIEKVVITRHMESNKDGDLATEMEVHIK